MGGMLWRIKYHPFICPSLLYIIIISPQDLHHVYIWALSLHIGRKENSIFNYIWVNLLYDLYSSTKWLFDVPFVNRDIRNVLLFLRVLYIQHAQSLFYSSSFCVKLVLMNPWLSNPWLSNLFLFLCNIGGGWLFSRTCAKSCIFAVYLCVPSSQL